ncbi:MAG: thiamine-phosphate pyrophosphorylase [Candidatus Atribacteria bacterium]|nr:thiamine-phosphate pyrophosphorylase [Candidatus Atribacteria bacterium]
MKLLDLSLYVITDRKIQKKSSEEVIEEAADAGASVIQLREKDLSTRLWVEEAQRAREVTRRKGIPLIINDRIDIALAVDADGVHLGEEDMPLVLARKIAPSLIIGYSVSTVEEAQKAEKEGADYLGAGTVFPTSTKKDTGEPIGLERLKEIKKAVHIPVVAIGGINLFNLEEVLATSVDGVAVVSAIVGAESVREATRSFRQKIELFRRKL